jgi:anti-anti-sigma factor
LAGYDRAGPAWAEEPALSITVTHCDDGLVVRVRGEIDLATRGEFERGIESACEAGGHVWLDLTDVAFLDPRGARTLGRLQATYARLRVASASAAVRRTAEIVELVDGTGPALDSGADSERGVAPR